MALGGLDRQILVPATDQHPRNMGADLVELADGSLFLAYSRWLGGADDYDASQICGLLSDDDGDTWSPAFDVAVPGSGSEAIRMPCLVRLASGDLACFARIRTSVADTWVGKILCRDEARLAQGATAWTQPERISPPAPGRHVLLNNRGLRLGSGEYAGRILLPIASPWPWDEEDRRGSDIRSWCLYSDDDGHRWQTSDSMLAGPQRGLMEPYVFELSDGRLRMFLRTQMSCQYQSLSEDGGNTWSPAVAAPLVSPESPVAVGREPISGTLVLVWNHNQVGRHTADRTPFTVAFSRDEGETWGEYIDLETDPDRSFSYPGVHSVKGRLFVTYYDCRDRRLSLVLRRFHVGGLGPI